MAEEEEEEEEMVGVHGKRGGEGGCGRRGPPRKGGRRRRKGGKKDATARGGEGRETKGASHIKWGEEGRGAIYSQVPALHRDYAAIERK